MRLTQAELAKRLKVVVSTVAHWELGTTPIPRSRLLACSDILKQPGLLQYGASANDRPQRSPQKAAMTLRAEPRESKALFGWWLPEAAKIQKAFDLDERRVNSLWDLFRQAVAVQLAISDIDATNASEDQLIKSAEDYLPSLVKGLHRRARADGIAA
jgi:transcriptional regulator with XRE-family HTH domain